MMLMAIPILSIVSVTYVLFNMQWRQYSTMYPIGRQLLEHGV